MCWPTQLDFVNALVNNDERIVSIDGGANLWVVLLNSSTLLSFGALGLSSDSAVDPGPIYGVVESSLISLAVSRPTQHAYIHRFRPAWDVAADPLVAVHASSTMSLAESSRGYWYAWGNPGPLTMCGLSTLDQRTGGLDQEYEAAAALQAGGVINVTYDLWSREILAWPLEQIVDAGYMLTGTLIVHTTWERILFCGRHPTQTGAGVDMVAAVLPLHPSDWMDQTQLELRSAGLHKLRGPLWSFTTTAQRSNRYEELDKTNPSSLARPYRSIRKMSVSGNGAHALGVMIAHPVPIIKDPLVLNRTELGNLSTIDVLIPISGPPLPRAAVLCVWWSEDKQNNLPSGFDDPEASIATT